MVSQTDAPVHSAEIDPSSEAGASESGSRGHRVVAVVYDGLCTFELGIAVEIFGRPRPELRSWYAFSLASVDSPPLRANGGMSVWAPEGLGPLEDADTIILPGWRDVADPPPQPLIDALRAAHRRGARLLSICSGVFVLAAAGLLDGRRATTHWRYAEALAKEFPEVRVESEVLYVDEGDILTSAGSAAGIDCCLHLVRRDYGAAVVNRVARRLVVQPHREGGQAQFITGAVVDPEEGGFADFLDSIRARLDEEHSVAGLAAEAAMSPRTLARRFRQVLGTTPHRWLVEERVRRCQELLETTDLDMDEIACLSGLGSAQVMRLHFRRRVGTTPTTYRKSFQGTPGGVG